MASLADIDRRYCPDAGKILANLSNPAGNGSLVLRQVTGGISLAAADN